MCINTNNEGAKEPQLTLREAAIQLHNAEIKPELIAKYYNMLKKTRDTRMLSNLKLNVKTPKKLYGHFSLTSP